MQDVAEVRAAFADPDDFLTSPLYRRLADAIADDAELLALAAHARDGQVASYAFFGAVHALLLAGAVHPLSAYYASLRGDDARAPDAAAIAAVRDFAALHADALRSGLSERLVQTNHVQRSVALRVGLAAVAAHTGATPVHLLEIGTSAGLLLRHEHYAYRLTTPAGHHDFGRIGSPVRLVSEWRGDTAVPALDAVPVLASSTGVDLNPLDPARDTDRRWLEALVWPEDRAKAALLAEALRIAADHPVTVLAGDAVDRAPQWAQQLPAGEPRVVFHCATRLHVPVARRPAFDDAIASTGADGPLHLITLEGDGLIVTDPEGDVIGRHRVEGHLAWASPAPLGAAVPDETA